MQFNGRWQAIAGGWTLVWLTLSVTTQWRNRTKHITRRHRQLVPKAFVSVAKTHHTRIDLQSSYVVCFVYYLLFTANRGGRKCLWGLGILWSNISSNPTNLLQCQSEYALSSRLLSNSNNDGRYDFIIVWVRPPTRLHKRDARKTLIDFEKLI